MKSTKPAAKALSIIGMFLLWFPILVMLITSPIVSNISQQFRIDYLLPAEIFPVALLGGILLLIASLLSKSHKMAVGVLLGLMILFFIGINIVSQITGLASGERASGDWAAVLTTGMHGAYIFCMLLLGIIGITLVRDLYRIPHKD